MGYFGAMKSTSRVLHLLLVLALLLNGLPGAALAGPDMADSASAGMEECPMTKAGGHASHVPAEYHDTAHQPAPTDGYCSDADCDHACVHHGSAAIALAVVLSSVPTPFVAVMTYATEFPSLTASPPFRPPIV